jgi:putative inorganic carbon (HCO3(-)) transporter
LTPDPFRRLSYYLTFAAVVASLCSNRACNLLIGAAFAALLFGHLRFGQALRFPPVKLPLALFFMATVIADALSGHALEGWPGIRKFYLCLMLLLVASTFRTLREVRALVIALTAAMSLSAVWSLYQFWTKVERARAAHQDFRSYYTPARITGFMSHWMTLSGQEMMVILMLLSLLLFAGCQRYRPWLLAGTGVLLLSLLLGYTRSMWMGAALGGMYLIWFRNRWLLLLAPAPILLLLWLNPAGLGDRLRSTVQPQGDLDSNLFRMVCRRAGWEMIKAHPWLGLGPEQVKAQFKNYIPPDVPRPLPTGAYIHLHNVYLQYAAERGVPALLAFLWWLGKMFCDFLRSLRSLATGDTERLWILQGCVAVMLATLSAAMYEHNLGDGEVLTLFLTICACGYRAIEGDAVESVISEF